MQRAQFVVGQGTAQYNYINERIPVDAAIISGKPAVLGRADGGDSRTFHNLIAFKSDCNLIADTPARNSAWRWGRADREFHVPACTARL